MQVERKEKRRVRDLAEPSSGLEPEPPPYHPLVAALFAADGNGFRLICRFSRLRDLRPVATGCTHGTPQRLDASSSAEATRARARGSNSGSRRALRECADRESKSEAPGGDEADELADELERLGIIASPSIVRIAPPEREHERNFLRAAGAT